MYLAKMKAEDCNNCSGFNEANLGAMLREIFVLGSESVSVMLRYVYLQLLREGYNGGPSFKT